MTRTQAWRIVAEAFGTPREERTVRQAYLTAHGLCHALARVHGWRSALGIISTLSNLAGDAWTWWYDDPIRVAPEIVSAERATFAGLMAAMTQRERDRLVEGL